jgi:ribosomal protein L11 methyltransferase
VKSGENTDVGRGAQPAPATIRARLRADEATVRRLADAFSECFDTEEIAVAAFAEPDGWTLEAYFREPPQEASIRALVALAGGALAANALAFDAVAARDWVKASLAGLEPVAAGRFLVHGRHDRARVSLNRIGIEIEAALAFGTGHHGTTRGCLLALDAILKARKPQRVLDIGTGTGVLAIAAAKAAHARVVASDIDARSVAVARANARGNGVAALIAVMRAVGVSAQRLRARAPFDLVFANILLGPLRGLASPAAALVAPGGRMVLSGLLPAQASAAISAYRAQDLCLERRCTLEGWVTLVLRRREKKPIKTAKR